MKKFKKIVGVSMATLMAASVLAGCQPSASTDPTDPSSGEQTVDEIYFLNFKPESADQYAAIAAKYKEETGVTVKVETAASGQYEQTLMSEVEKDQPPTIFQINGPVGYQNWTDYTADLKDTELYDMLSSGGKDLAVENDGGVYGIPYAVEGYGIIYNNAIMDKYFASSSKTSSISSMDEIKSYDALKEVVEDMTKIKDELGIEGVFASTSFSAGNDWRWQTHLANMPFYYEFSENTSFSSPILAGLDAATVEFKYAEGYKNIFDLYTNNSITEKTLLSGKSVDDSMAEFALGQVAMVQNGNWGWGQISGVDGNTVVEDDVKFLPIFTGAKDEENLGICIGTENYFAINSQVDEATQQASIDFLVWLFSSEEGKKAVTNDLGFITPFTTFSEAEAPSDPLAKEVLRYQADENYSNPVWAFASFPSEQFKADFGAALLEYVQDQKTWDDVVNTVKTSWETERANAG